MGRTVTFVQESWDGERAQYQIEDEMIVFLAARSRGFGRLAGPFGVFLVRGTQVVSRNSSVNTDDMTPAELLSKLRVLAKGQKAPQQAGRQRWLTALVSTRRHRARPLTALLPNVTIHRQL